VIAIREENTGDIAAIRVLSEHAFGQRVEAGIVDQLRAACLERLSLMG
jgi:predicted N-acetyltransferase YhbS